MIIHHVDAREAEGREWAPEDDRAWMSAVESRRRRARRCTGAYRCTAHAAFTAHAAQTTRATSR